MQVLEELRGFAEWFEQWRAIVSALHGPPKGKDKGDTTNTEVSGVQFQELVVAAAATEQLKIPTALVEKLWKTRLSETSNEHDWDTWAGLVTFNESVWPDILSKHFKTDSTKAAIIEVIIDQLRKPDNLDEFRKVMLALRAVENGLEPLAFKKDVQDLHQISFVHEVAEDEVEDAVSTRDQLCDLRATMPSNWAKAMLSN